MQKMEHFDISASFDSLVLLFILFMLEYVEALICLLFLT